MLVSKPVFGKGRRQAGEGGGRMGKREGECVWGYRLSVATLKVMKNWGGV